MHAAVPRPSRIPQCGVGPGSPPSGGGGRSTEASALVIWSPNGLVLQSNGLTALSPGRSPGGLIGEEPIAACRAETREPCYVWDWRPLAPSPSGWNSLDIQVPQG